MPFDALPENIVSDLVKLRLARDGMARSWLSGQWGDPDETAHCTVGWLLKATDWDAEATARLVHDYVHPALPKSAQRKTSAVWAVSNYNDTHSQPSVMAVIDRAIALATPHGE